MGFDDVDAFLVDFWEAFWSTLDANNLLSQLHTWQTADISATPGYDGDLARALGDIRAKAVLASRARRTSTSRPRTWRGRPSRCATPSCAVIPGVWGHFSEVGIDPSCNEFLGNSIRMLLAR